MLASTGKALGLDGTITNAPPTDPTKPEVKVATRTPLTIGEMAAEKARKDKEGIAPAPPAAIAPADPVPAPAPPAPSPAPAPPVSRLRPKPVAPLPVAPPPLAVQPPPVALPVIPPADPDAAFTASLDEDQRMELEIATFAEGKFPELKGKRAETLGYFRKVEDYARTNPNASQEDLDTFITANKPKWNPAMKRKVERAQITEEATQQATQAVRAEMQPRLNEANQRILNLDLSPAIERKISDLESLASSPEILPDAATMEAMPAEVAQRITEVGYEQAKKEFKVEAPIFQGMKNAARSYLRMASGLDARNTNDPLQNFVVNFVEEQGQIHASKPASETTVNGRQFLRLEQYNAAVAQNPQVASAYYTFSERDVLDLLAISANIQYNNEIASLKQAGYERVKKPKVSTSATPAPVATPAPPVVAAPPAAPIAGSAKVRPSPPPNPNTAVPARSENASFIDSIAPGKAHELGIS